MVNTNNLEHLCSKQVQTAIKCLPRSFVCFLMLHSVFIYAQVFSWSLHRHVQLVSPTWVILSPAHA